MKVVVLSGIPGSGKSTYARERFPDAVVFSADAYFTDPADGTYRFNPALLGVAHGQCLRGFAYALHAGAAELLVVDNTNLTVAELAPYAALALAYNAELQIITICCDIETAATRNVHGVPRHSIARMWSALGERKLPPWWPHEWVTLGLGLS